MSRGKRNKEKVQIHVPIIEKKGLDHYIEASQSFKPITFIFGSLQHIILGLLLLITNLIYLLPICFCPKLVRLPFLIRLGLGNSLVYIYVNLGHMETSLSQQLCLVLVFYEFLNFQLRLRVKANGFFVHMLLNNYGFQMQKYYD